MASMGPVSMRFDLLRVELGQGRHRVDPEREDAGKGTDPDPRDEDQRPHQRFDRPHEVHEGAGDGVGESAPRDVPRVRLRADGKASTKATGMAKAVAMKARKMVWTSSTRPSWSTLADGWMSPRTMSAALPNLVRKAKQIELGDEPPGEEGELDEDRGEPPAQRLGPLEIALPLGDAAHQRATGRRAEMAVEEIPRQRPGRDRPPGRPRRSGADRGSAPPTQQQPGRTAATREGQHQELEP